MEMEGNNELSFLDVKVKREGSKFVTSVYRKPSFSGLGLSFFSFCPFRFKINVLKNLLFRAFNICSSYNLFHNELTF